MNIQCQQSAHYTFFKGYYKKIEIKNVCTTRIDESTVVLRRLVQQIQALDWILYCPRYRNLVMQGVSVMMPDALTARAVHLKLSVQPSLATTFFEWSVLHL